LFINVLLSFFKTSQVGDNLNEQQLQQVNNSLFVYKCDLLFTKRHFSLSCLKKLVDQTMLKADKDRDGKISVYIFKKAKRDAIINNVFFLLFVV
jgi:hypothetical protein